MSTSPTRPLKKSYRNLTGLVFSRKLGRHVQFDSTLERDFSRFLDLHPQVERFQEQPVEIHWVDSNDRRRVYFPDFFVEFKPGLFLGRKVTKPWIVETKYRDMLTNEWEQLRPKFRAGVAEAATRSCEFHIVTERFRSSVAAANMRLLQKFTKSGASATQIDEITSCLRARETSTPREIVAKLAVSSPLQDEYLSTLWACIAQGHVATDFERPLETDSLIWGTST